MYKMGSHDPFEYLKHKLWPKEEPGVKLAFDSQSQKITNLPDFLTCKWLATYHWKFLYKGYNFALDLTSIGGLHTKLWASKVARVPILGISGVPLGSPETK
jgi:hypothetical protein